MNISDLQAISLLRTARWHPNGLEEWSALEWAGAMAGEAGEACNAAKKLKRLETELQSINNEVGRHFVTCDEARLQVAKEIADTILYGLILATRVGFTGAEFECIIADVFNQKSQEYNFPERVQP